MRYNTFATCLVPAGDAKRVQRGKPSTYAEPFNPLEGQEDATYMSANTHDRENANTRCNGWEEG